MGTIFSQFMVHTMTLVKGARTTGDYGHQQTSWEESDGATLYEDLACRMYPHKLESATEEMQTGAVVADYDVLIEWSEAPSGLGAHGAESRWRISTLTTPDGSEGPYDIVKVSNSVGQSQHFVLQVKRTG